MRFTSHVLSVPAALAVAAFGGAVRAGQGGWDDEARLILDAAGAKGGLIAHVGCGDGRLTAALHAGGRFVVHGLDADAADVQRAREHVRRLGLYGPVSVERFDGGRLPYADNLLNLVVAENPGIVPEDEALRVLAPGGALFVRREGQWGKTVKPRPVDTDEWTHFLHDPSGNAVSRDRVVGPPRRLQWVEDPRHMRSHEHTPGIFALVSGGGRIFYIQDEAPASSILRLPRWHLVARDAYNGILLWKRPFSPWLPHLINWGFTPEALQRRLVSGGGRLYVTLGLHAPLSALDAATGETLRVYEGTDGAEEVLHCEGVLLLALRAVTPERVAELDKWARMVKEQKSPLHTRDSAQPLVDQLRGTDNRSPRAIMAVDAGSGRVLWRKEGKEATGLRPLSLCAVGDRVFYQRGRDVFCVDLRSGRERWSVPAVPMRLAFDGGVACADGNTAMVLAADDGKVLWTRSSPLAEIRDAFVVGRSLWLGGFKPWEGPTPRGAKRGPSWNSYLAVRLDLASGKEAGRIEPENPQHHHRCFRNKATERYILGGRRGVEFLDLNTGDVLWHSWVRGVCRYGVMPSNGLLYAPPHACGCYITAKLTGFYALGSGPPGRSPADPREYDLEKGAAYGAVSPQPPREDNWPTYRHDGARSGWTRSQVRAALRRRWQADIGGRLSGLTVAAGKVFAASVDRYEVCALEADTGRQAWTFTAGGRVDSPPTIHEGRAIFGCRDGYVYSVRASDGAPDWRLRAARADQRVTACGRLESVFPVHGSVLVQGGSAYFTAGRSSYLDGGIDLFRIQPATGKVLSVTPIYSPDPATGRQPPQMGPCEMPGALSDILAGDGEFVYLRDLAFDGGGAPRQQGKPHLLTLTGYLDDTWPHRSYWIFGTRCSLSTGCSQREKNLVYGRILVFDEASIYGYGRSSVHWSNQLEDGAYRLFSARRADRSAQWSKQVPIAVRAMVLADKVLFVAGPPAVAVKGPEVRGGTLEGRLMAFSAVDGGELGEFRLDVPPVFDGMAAAGGRLYVSLENGRVLCLEGEGAR